MSCCGRPRRIYAADDQPFTDPLASPPTHTPCLDTPPPTHSHGQRRNEFTVTDQHCAADDGERRSGETSFVGTGSAKKKGAARGKRNSVAPEPSPSPASKDSRPRRKQTDTPKPSSSGTQVETEESTMSSKRKSKYEATNEGFEDDENVANEEHQQRTDHTDPGAKGVFSTQGSRRLPPIETSLKKKRSQLKRQNDLRHNEPLKDIKRDAKPDNKANGTAGEHPRHSGVVLGVHASRQVGGKPAENSRNKAETSSKEEVRPHPDIELVSKGKIFFSVNWSLLDSLVSLGLGNVIEYVHVGREYYVLMSFHLRC